MHTKHNFIYNKSSATCFGYKSHLQAEHIFIVGNVYCNAMNVMDEAVSYIKMEVL